MIWIPQTHFTTLHRPINQGDSETQRKPIDMVVAFDTKSVGFLSVSGQCGVYGENFVFL